MNGAECLTKSLVRSGLRACFAWNRRQVRVKKLNNVRSQDAGDTLAAIFAKSRS
jgi:hypothetical protein